VTYSNLVLPEAFLSTDHPVWQWLAQRSKQIAGLSLELDMELGNEDDTDNNDTHDNATNDNGTDDAVEVTDWEAPLQTLSGISGVQLKLDWFDAIEDRDHPCISWWLNEYGQIISHFSGEFVVSVDRLKLREVAEAAAPCRAVDLTIKHPSSQVFDLADLLPVAGSLQRLGCWCTSDSEEFGSVRGASAFNSMSQLTDLQLVAQDLQDEDPWGLLASLTSLQQLGLCVHASGDPSPLSALTRLSFLIMKSYGGTEAHGFAPFSFSSLQPLSTLRQLEVLDLKSCACAATSLQGLAGLTKLKVLAISSPASQPNRLSTLEGISPGVMRFSIVSAPDLVSLAGIGACTGMMELFLVNCGVHSLQPLRGLASLNKLMLHSCSVTSLEGIYGLSLRTFLVIRCSSLTQLSGVEHLPALIHLVVEDCGCVTSLQPLSQLGEGLQELVVKECSAVQEEVLELPHVKPTADVVVESSNVKEVVLAGGVRRDVGAP
jgi:hypothetical protein